MRGHRGPDLVDRIERNARLSDMLVEQAPEPLRPMYEFAAAQARRHLAVARRFGRHPHRNAILGRPSTEAEASYLREGRFPHETPIQL